MDNKKLHSRRFFVFFCETINVTKKYPSIGYEVTASGRLATVSISLETKETSLRLTIVRLPAPPMLT